MRINPFFMPIALIVVFVGTTWAAQAGGIWSTSGRTAIEAGTMAAADLKGWMTLQQIMDGLRLSKETVYGAGNIPLDTPPDTALKDLEKTVPGFETSVLRDALSGTTTGAPVAPALPADTVPLATVQPTIAPAGIRATLAPLTTGQVLLAQDIKGRMTLKEVSEQCAVPFEALLAGLNLPAGTDPATTIKDLIAQTKLADVTDVQKVVEALQTK